MALKNLKLDRLSAKELLDLEKKTQAAYEKLRQKEKRALLRRWRGEAKASTGILQSAAAVPMPTPMKIRAQGRF